MAICFMISALILVFVGEFLSIAARGFWIKSGRFCAYNAAACDAEVLPTGLWLMRATTMRALSPGLEPERFALSVPLLVAARKLFFCAREPTELWLCFNCCTIGPC